MDWIIKWMDHRCPISLIRWMDHRFPISRRIRRSLIRRMEHRCPISRRIRWSLIRWMDYYWASVNNWLVISRIMATFRISSLISLILTRSYWVINNFTSD